MVDFTIPALTAIGGPLADTTLFEVSRAGQAASEKAAGSDLKSYLGKALVDIAFHPADNEPPASAYATLDTRNGHPVLDFDDTVAEAAIFTGLLQRGYGGGGLTVEVGYSMTSAVTGTCGWTVEFERIANKVLDIDADSFAAAQTITAVTVPGTSGLVDVVSVAVANGAAMASLAAGEQFRLRVKRDVATDTAVGDAELNFVRVKET